MKKLVVILFAVVFIFSMCSCWFPFRFDYYYEDPYIYIDEEQRCGMGETAWVDGLEITMTEIKQTYGEASFEAADGKIFLLVFFEIKNVYDMDDYIDDTLFTAYVDDYSTSVSLRAGTGESADPLGGNLSMGRKMHGYIGYEVPENWRNLEIEFSTYYGYKIIFFAENDNGLLV